MINHQCLPADDQLQFFILLFQGCYQRQRLQALVSQSRRVLMAGAGATDMQTFDWLTACEGRVATAIRTFDWLTACEGRVATAMRTFDWFKACARCAVHWCSGRVAAPGATDMQTFDLFKACEGRPVHWCSRRVAAPGATDMQTFDWLTACDGRAVHWCSRRVLMGLKVSGGASAVRTLSGWS